MRIKSDIGIFFIAVLFFAHNSVMGGELPAGVNWDDPVTSVRTVLAKHCASTRAIEVDPPSFPLANAEPSTQAQVNCFGYEYAGFPRKFEAIYGDGILEVVWILTGKGEENRVRQALIEAFGPAENINDQWETFAGFRVSLRKDKPEVLLLSERMVPYYKKELLGVRNSP